MNRCLLISLLLSLIVMSFLLFGGVKISQTGTQINLKPTGTASTLAIKESSSSENNKGQPIRNEDLGTNNQGEQKTSEKKNGDDGNTNNNNQKRTELAPPSTISVTTENISPSALLPPGRNWKNDECAWVTRIALDTLGVPSDITMLLPILGSYEREEDHQTVVELGSRLGSSTNTLLRAMSYDPKKKFATADLEIRQPVAAMYKAEKTCSKESGYEGRVLETIQGNDMTIDIPFVKKGYEEKPENSFNPPYRPIDMLFIDTLHDGSLLEVELQRYPRFVRRTIAFHDAFSFYGRNEGPPSYFPPGWPSGKRKPMGLHVVIRNFLMNHPEWVEEMNNVHNNGLFVIRRREVVPNLQFLTSGVPRFTGFEMEPTDEVKKILAEHRDYASSHRGIQTGAINDCNHMFDTLYRRLGIRKEHVSPPCHVAPFTAFGFASGLYSIFLRTTDDRLPLAVHLGNILSNVLVPVHYITQPTVYVWGCELSVFTAAAHAIEQTSRKQIFCAPFTPSGPDSLSTTNKIASCPLQPQLNEYLNRVGHPAEFSIPTSQERKTSKHVIDVIVVSAANIAKLSKQKLQELVSSVGHRFVVYGTTLYPMKTLHELLVNDGDAGKRENFELKTNLVKNAGFAMWERRKSTVLNYVPEAKQKHG